MQPLVNHKSLDALKLRRQLLIERIQHEVALQEQFAEPGAIRLKDSFPILSHFREMLEETLLEIKAME